MGDQTNKIERGLGYWDLYTLLLSDQTNKIERNNVFPNLSLLCGILFKDQTKTLSECICVVVLLIDVICRFELLGVWIIWDCLADIDCVARWFLDCYKLSFGLYGIG